MGKYQKWTVTFLTLTSASMLFGQACKMSFTYAPLFGFFFGFAFSILALIMAVKASAERKF